MSNKSSEDEMAELVVVFYTETSYSIDIAQLFKNTEGVSDAFVVSNEQSLIRLVKGNPSAFVVLDTPYDRRSRVETFLKSSRQNYIVLCGSKSEAHDIFRSGVTEFLVKPEEMTQNFAALIIYRLRSLKSRLTNIYARELKADYGDKFTKILVIGSSTGGTEAAAKIIPTLPKDFPPVVLVQHMPPVFTRLYAERLNKESAMSVWEAKDGDVLRNGLCLIVPGKTQLEVKRSSSGLYASVYEDNSSRINKPSVDVTFKSVAELNIPAVGVILTGMGSDGAEGLKAMHDKGAFTIGQNKETCVVYGMPKAAYDAGAVDVQADIESIASIIMKNMR